MTDPKSEHPTKYNSYLLRLWEEGGKTGWRLYLKNIDTGAQKGFLSVESLVDYLQSQIEAERCE